MTELANTRTGELVPAGGLTRQQLDLIKRTVARGATDDELRLFEMVCNQTGLNPFVGQIWLIKRREQDPETNQWKDAMSIQTGIAGYRLIAERTGRWAGRLGPFWCGPDGQWRDVWLDEAPPAAARVGILKAGAVEPFWGIARWKAYAQTKQNGEPTRMWRRQDAEQLGKCAEAVALRAAFPQDTAGVYTTDEMAQAANELSPAGDGDPPPSPADFHQAQQQGSAARRRVEQSGAGEREPANSEPRAAVDGEGAGRDRHDPAPDPTSPSQPDDADSSRTAGAAPTRATTVNHLARALGVHPRDALGRLEAAGFGCPKGANTTIGVDDIPRARALITGEDGS